MTTRAPRETAPPAPGEPFTYLLTCEAVPAQAQGRYARSDRPYYFRARHGRWSLEVAPPGYPEEMLAWPDRYADDHAHFTGPDDTWGWGWDDDMIRRVIAAAEDAL